MTLLCISMFLNKYITDSLFLLYFMFLNKRHKSNNRCTYTCTGHFQHWKKERKEIAFLYTAIPSCSQWSSLSSKLHVYKIRGVRTTKVQKRKWLGGYP
jgi:hypothetical protein